MNYYSVFYWLTVADGVKKCFDVFSNIFSWFAVLAFLTIVVSMIGKACVVSSNRLKNENEDKTDSDWRAWEAARKIAMTGFYIMLPLCIITWIGYVATPTKKDCLLIVAGGAVGNFITTDSSSKALPADVTQFLHLSLKNEIKSLGEEAKKEISAPIGLQTPKDKFLDKMKELTKEEIIEYMKNDSTVIAK